MDSSREEIGTLGETVSNEGPRSIQHPTREFWAELNATLDEFFAVIQASNDRLAELSGEVVKRDSLIALLEAQNTALRTRLGLLDPAPEKAAAFNLRSASVLPGPATPVPASVPIAAPAGPGPARSIWHKLSQLDRDL